jgi:hypothetical protein
VRSVIFGTSWSESIAEFHGIPVCVPICARSIPEISVAQFARKPVQVLCNCAPARERIRSPSSNGYARYHPELVPIQRKSMLLSLRSSHSYLCS